MTQKVGSGIPPLAVNLGTVVGWSVNTTFQPPYRHEKFSLYGWDGRLDRTQIEAEPWRRGHLTLRGFEFRFPGGTVCRPVTMATEIFVLLCRSMPQNKIKGFCSVVPIWKETTGET